MSFVKLVEGLNEMLAPLAKQLAEMANQVNVFLKDNPGFFDDLKLYFENIPDIHSKIWKNASENGWFANWFISIEFDLVALDGKESLDKFMISNLEEDLNEIEEKLVSLYPARCEILKIAFELHKQKNYIAAIPLLISQSDGICAQNLGAFLFTEHDKRSEKIAKIVEDSPEELEKIFWTPITGNTKFGAGIGKNKKEDKEKAPNRSGIMHGSRKHLDYGTKVNSLKCISLLAYTAFIFDRD